MTCTASVFVSITFYFNDEPPDPAMWRKIKPPYGWSKRMGRGRRYCRFRCRDKDHVQVDAAWVSMMEAKFTLVKGRKP